MSMSEWCNGLERRSPNWKIEGSIPELWHIDSHADPLRDLYKCMEGMQSAPCRWDL